MDGLTAQRIQWLLEQKGLLEESMIPGNGRPIAKLIELYASHHSSQLPNESIFPPGTQYEAFKAVTAAASGARQTVKTSRRTPTISFGGPALVANSLCRGQEKRTICQPEVQIRYSGRHARLAMSEKVDRGGG